MLYIWILIGVILNVIGSVTMKLWAEYKLPIWPAITFYLLDAFAWAYILRRYSVGLGRTTILWVVMETILALIVSHLLFKEHLSNISLMGAVAAIFGVTLMEIG